VLAAQLRCLVAVEGDVQGAAAPVAGVDGGGSLELGDERRIAAGGLDGELDQSLLAERQLADGRQHPCGDARRPRRRRGAVDDRHPGAADCGAPGAALAHQARADDDRVVALLSLCSRHLSVAAAHGSLRRHYPDQVQTVGGAVAALSARGLRAPVHLDATPPRAPEAHAPG
jgi:hypothetical protein